MLLRQSQEFMQTSGHLKSRLTSNRFRTLLTATCTILWLPVLASRSRSSDGMHINTTAGWHALKGRGREADEATPFAGCHWRLVRQCEWQLDDVLMLRDARRPRPELSRSQPQRRSHWQASCQWHPTLISLTVRAETSSAPHAASGFRATAVRRGCGLGRWSRAGGRGRAGRGPRGPGRRWSAGEAARCDRS